MVAKFDNVLISHVKKNPISQEQLPRYESYKLNNLLVKSFTNKNLTL